MFSPSIMRRQRHLFLWRSSPTTLYRFLLMICLLFDEQVEQMRGTKTTIFVPLGQMEKVITAVIVFQGNDLSRNAGGVRGELKVCNHQVVGSSPTSGSMFFMKTS